MFTGQSVGSCNREVQALCLADLHVLVIWVWVMLNVIDNSEFWCVSWRQSGVSSLSEYNQKTR